MIQDREVGLGGDQLETFCVASKEKVVQKDTYLQHEEIKTQ